MTGKASSLIKYAGYVIPLQYVPLDMVMTAGAITGLAIITAYAWKRYGDSIKEAGKKLKENLVGLADSNKSTNNYDSLASKFVMPE